MSVGLGRNGRDLNSADRALLDSLRQQTLEVLRDVLGSAPRDVVYLDAPTYRNFGDSMIWEGAHRYLRTLGHRIRYVSDARRFRDVDLRRAPSNATIILQGGGNLGDLWPAHEEFRRHIARTYPSRRMILMPQTVHFGDRTGLAESLEAYRPATRLTILLRDSRSMEFATSEFGEIDYRFCPDAAFGLGVPHSVRPQEKEAVILVRDDKEARDEDRAFAANLVSVDWSSTVANQRLWRRITWAMNYYARAPDLLQRVVRPPSMPYTALRSLNMGSAVRQFSGAPWVVTNRLHAHVLAALLGIPHVVTDNSYGKIRSIFDDSSGRFTTAHWADSLEDAMTVAAEWTEKEDVRDQR